MKFATKMYTRPAPEWSAEEWAEYFRDAYRGVLLRQQTDAVTADDLYWATEALDEYERLSIEAKGLLQAEKAVLDGLLHR
jgi:hypothetical protein